MNDNDPIVLGKVKKGGKSKPIIVVFLFLFIGAFVFLLPTILNYFGEYSIVDLIKSGEIVDFISNHDAYIRKGNSDDDEDTTTPIKKEFINSKTILNGYDFTLSDFTLTTTYISFKVNISKNTNLLDNNYYLVLTKDDDTLANIKVTNDIIENNYIKFVFKEKLSTDIKIEGIINTMNDSEYPSFSLTSDESGLASLICTKNNDSYEYLFYLNKLSNIKSTVYYSDNGDNKEYLNKFDEYSKLADEINNSNNYSKLLEDNNGFTFKTDIDLNSYEKKINDNYYSYNTNSNKVKFDMETKGYDCK